MDMLPVYKTMLHAVGSLNNRSNGITAGTYVNGFGLISFDLTRANQSGDSDISDVSRIGDLQVHMTFRETLPLSCSFIFILERNSNIYVQGNSNVTTDFLS